MRDEEVAKIENSARVKGGLLRLTTFLSALADKLVFEYDDEVNEGGNW